MIQIISAGCGDRLKDKIAVLSIDFQRVNIIYTFAGCRIDQDYSFFFRIKISSSPRDMDGDNIGGHFHLDHNTVVAK